MEGPRSTRGRPKRHRGSPVDAFREALGTLRSTPVDFLLENKEELETLLDDATEYVAAVMETQKERLLALERQRFIMRHLGLCKKEASRYSLEMEEKGYWAEDGTCAGVTTFKDPNDITRFDTTIKLVKDGQVVALYHFHQTFKAEVSGGFVDFNDICDHEEAWNSSGLAVDKVKSLFNSLVKGRFVERRIETVVFKEPQVKRTRKR